MIEQATHIRKLTLHDQTSVQNLQTNIEDDYVVHIFPDLIENQTHAVYGVFENETLITIAGYSLFPGGYAMLGRLRSDIRYMAKGYATKILTFIIEDLKNDPSIKWIGANTNIHNHAAKRVLAKLELEQITTLHALPVREAKLLNGVKGDRWLKVVNPEEKRALLSSFADSQPLVFPYECYYLFPYTEALITDKHLAESTFYQNQTKDRFMIIRNDQKHEWFAHVKYFWDDAFEQPGFWETVYHYVEKESKTLRPWLDFSQEGFNSIPNLEAFDVEDGWALYGNWINRTNSN
ncbi:MULTISPECIES: GNAT family N-acetyltransferase [Paraliobacillus]|uniref:GNAT family N-acetyltransferase n=1 Tax=Paraliobacillus TaxID=200903 RepID=UPI000DD435D9|nr:MULTISPECIES: GNAT family N-acetyltransferase [Paraliobacillus]